MDKILIFEDTGAKNQFIANCETTRDQANDLITLFESFQDLSSVTTAEMFERLVSDPVGYFDAVLRSNVDMKMTGGREPEPSVLAKLFGYDRENYVKSIQGLPITEGCKSCKGETIIRKTKAALTDTRWSAYRDYLSFTPTGFELNEAEIEKHCERFKTFATTPKQMEVVEHYNSLVTILNSHDEMFPIAGPDKDTLTRIFGLHLERPPYQGKFLTNPETLRNSIN